MVNEWLPRVFSREKQNWKVATKQFLNYWLVDVRTRFCLPAKRVFVQPIVDIVVASSATITYRRKQEKPPVDSSFRVSVLSITRGPRPG